MNHVNPKEMTDNYETYKNPAFLNFCSFFSCLSLCGKKYFFAIYVLFCGEFSSFYNYPVILRVPHQKLLVRGSKKI